MCVLEKVSLIVCALALLPAAVRADSAVVTEGVQGGYSFEGMGVDAVVGWQFAVNADITAYALGVFDANQWLQPMGSGDGLASAHAVGIWDSHQSLVASATVPAGSDTTLIDGFRYVNISGVQLHAGQTYTVGALFHSSDGDGFIDVYPFPFHINSNITYITSKETIFWSGGGTLSCPNTSHSSVDFGPNFLLVPEPATLSLLALGGLLIVRRRRG